MYRVFFKRFFDIVFSSILLILLFPVYLILCILIRIKIGKPIFFKQKRPGKDEKIFTLIKFRTMKNSQDKDGILLPDEQRLNEFGKFLRKTSLDELPEIWNIFLGEMSFVGPRPLLVEYLELYNEEQKKRHNVRPGLTGLAQVNGRNMLGWEEKFKYDVEYCDNITFENDFKILIKTVIKVVAKEGISSEGMETTTKFTGKSYSSDNGKNDFE